MIPVWIVVVLNGGVKFHLLCWFSFWWQVKRNERHLWNSDNDWVMKWRLFWCRSRFSVVFELFHMMVVWCLEWRSGFWESLEEVGFCLFGGEVKMLKKLVLEGCHSLLQGVARWDSVWSQWLVWLIVDDVGSISEKGNGVRFPFSGDSSALYEKRDEGVM